MTVAAAEVVTGIGDLLGIAVRYGYGPAEAFGRAFQSVHGVSPGQRMAKLICSKITSLDGYAEATGGDVGTGAEEQEMHTFINDLLAPSARTSTAEGCTRRSACETYGALSLRTEPANSWRSWWTR